MKNGLTVERNKVMSIWFLFITSTLIILSGASLMIYSFINNVYFTVLTSQIHGAVFGTVIAFLGARYFLSVQKLKSEVYKTTSRFSWQNFRKLKNAKNR